MDKEVFFDELNYANLCRLCLIDCNNSNSLFDCVEYEEKIELWRVLSSITSIKTPPNNKKPNKICIDCTDTLISCYNFVNKTQENDRLLDEFLLHKKKSNLSKQKNIKSEQETQIGNLISEPIKNEIFEDSKTLNDDDMVVETLELDGNEPTISKISSTKPKRYGRCNKIEKYRCEYCDKRFTNLKLMQVHLKQHKENKSCHICNEAFLSKVLLHNHIKTVHSANCKKEQSIAKVKVMPELMICEANENSNLGENQNSSSTTIKTEQTIQHDQSLSTSTTYHNRVDHHDFVDLEENSLQTSLKTKKFSCCICCRTYSRQDNLQRHELTHSEFTKNETKPAQNQGLCPFCGQSFSQASLIIHIRRHTGEKPYKCDMCEKGFPRSQDLTIHKRSHTGEKPHICGTCGKAFTRPNKLNRHLRIHTNERPYKCPHCGRAFRQSNDLILHIRRHTGERPYICEICSESFIHGTALRNHQKATGHHENEKERDRYASIRVNNPNRGNWKEKFANIKSSDVETESDNLIVNQQNRPSVVVENVSSIQICPTFTLIK